MHIQDLSLATLRTENEIDNAIYAVLNAAFSESEDEPALRGAVRSRLCESPTPQDVIDAVCAELRGRGRLRFEKQRRLQASQVLAAFFDLPAGEREDLSLAPPAA